MAWTFEDVQEGAPLPPFVVEQLTRTSPPDLFLGYSITHDRGYLAAPQQAVLARQFPINEGSNTAYRVDLLGYDSAEQRPLLLTVRVRSTTTQWLWEALFGALNVWLALRATAGFAAGLGEHPVTAIPAVGVVAPRIGALQHQHRHAFTAREEVAVIGAEGKSAGSCGSNLRRFPNAKQFEEATS